MLKILDENNLENAEYRKTKKGYLLWFRNLSRDDFWWRVNPLIISGDLTCEQSGNFLCKALNFRLQVHGEFICNSDKKAWLDNKDSFYARHPGNER